MKVFKNFFNLSLFFKSKIREKKNFEKKMIQININNQGGGMMPGGGMMHNPNVVPQPVRKDAG